MMSFKSLLLLLNDNNGHVQLANPEHKKFSNLKFNLLLSGNINVVYTNIAYTQREFAPVAATGRISLAANGSLVIRNADKSDEANYLCKSSNGIGKGISWRASLKITGKFAFYLNLLQALQI